MANEAQITVTVTPHASNFQPGAPFYGGISCDTAGYLKWVTVGGTTQEILCAGPTMVKAEVERVLVATATAATGITGYN